ncbi:probable DNA-directed RNA polymerase subunit delta [Gossypium hirsutum]|uniref:Probable DNA-directed RNA polymerase subunit delta n=1 Tax=Gossypium hirsutum TaxID=3635 RepID=A0A1U8LL93_GOSHI|nr:probable DNA-directed RNA polymerase subunit delta [Gossypium hirsutum]
MEMISNLQRQIGTRILSDTENNPQKDEKQHVNTIILQSSKTLNNVSALIQIGKDLQKSAEEPMDKNKSEELIEKVSKSLAKSVISNPVTTKIPFLLRIRRNKVETKQTLYGVGDPMDARDYPVGHRLRTSIWYSSTKSTTQQVCILPTISKYREGEEDDNDDDDDDDDDDNDEDDGDDDDDNDEDDGDDDDDNDKDDGDDDDEPFQAYDYESTFHVTPRSVKS